MTRNRPLTWVGVAGFEPAASSSRNQRATSQTGQITAFAQVSHPRKETITASEAAWPRLAVPILLPKSDIVGEPGKAAPRGMVG
jgi:hypothetical protein